MPKIIYLWSDNREKSAHQMYVIKDYQKALGQLGYGTFLNTSRDWAAIVDGIKSIKPNLFLLHGGKVFPAQVAKEISKICPIYLRWRWHPDPPKDLLDISTIASKVSFIKNDYKGKLFYSPHPCCVKYFHPCSDNEDDEVKYCRDVFFVGLAGKRGKHFYSRSKRNAILASDYVYYLNKIKFNSGDIGFYNWQEIAKFYKNSNLCLSVSSFDDEVNFRVFNIMGCKSVLVSDVTTAMLRHFEPNKDFIPFKKDSVEDFNQVIKSIQNENNSKIAQNGYKKIMNEHTSKIRLLEALKKIGV